MRELMIKRLVELCKKAALPGFEHHVEQTAAKMQQMSDQDLVLLFETTVTYCFHQKIA
jgi:hypothetical protein